MMHRYISPTTLLTVRISFIGEVCRVPRGTRPEGGPKGTALHALLQPRDIDVLRKTAIFELVLEFIVVDVVFVFAAQEDHQIIVAI
jgi:hypothetical protein